MVKPFLGCGLTVAWEAGSSSFAMRLHGPEDSATRITRGIVLVKELRGYPRSVGEQGRFRPSLLTPIT